MIGSVEGQWMRTGRKNQFCMRSDISGLDRSSQILARVVAEHKLWDTQKAVPGAENRFTRGNSVGCSWPCTDWFWVHRLESSSGRENINLLFGSPATDDGVGSGKAKSTNTGQWKLNIRLWEDE